MNEPLIALIAVVCNVIAQIAMKYAGTAGQGAKGLAALLSPWLIGAVAFYGLSFLLTIRVLAVNPLSVASPTMAGCTFLFITLASWLVLGEGMGWQKLAGIGCILIGILLLTRQ
jgi:multidrug transporter EmrE-like cation transporter